MATLYDRFAAQATGISAYNYMQKQNMNALKARHDYYAMPEAENSFSLTRSTYEEILNQAKQAYAGEDDPDSYSVKFALGQIFHSLNPDIDPAFAMEHVPDMMRLATGYDPTPESLGEKLIDVFKSTGSGTLAGYKTAVTLGIGALNGFKGEEWERAYESFQEDLKTYANTYRSDYDDFDLWLEDIFNEPLTAAAQFFPSMLPSITIDVLAGLMTGGTINPVTMNVIRGAKGLSRFQKGVQLAATGAKAASIAWMEAGSAELEMLNAGFSPSVSLFTGTGVGILNMAAELAGDKLESVIANPITQALNRLNPKAKNRVIRTSIKESIKEFRSNILKSELTEIPTENLQNWISMLGFNLAYNIEKENGNSLPGVLPYTRRDFVDSFWETTKSVFLGTGVLSFGSGLINLGMNLAPGGELRQSLQADRFFNVEGATKRIASSEIIHQNSSINNTVEIDKQKPVEVVRIGDKYRAVNTTDEQNAAITRSKQAYVKEIDMSTEKAIGKKVDFDTVDMHSPVKRSVVESVINSGMSNGKIAGFTYYNENLARVTDPSKAAYISLVESKDSDPIMIPLSEESTISAIQLQKDVFGETLVKVSPASETEATTAESTSSSSDSEQDSTDIEAEYGEILDEEEQDSDTFTEEELSEAETAISNIPESEKTIPDGTENTETTVPINETSLQETVNETERKPSDIGSALQTNTQPETVSNTETTLQEDTQNDDINAYNIPKVSEETTQETEASPAQDTRTPEEIRADEDTARRNERNQARIDAQNKWDQVQRMLTGTDSANDVEVLTIYFYDLLGNTRLGESDQALEATARASAEIAVGFAKAAGMKGQDYFKTINAFMSEDFVPTIEDGTVYFQPAYHGGSADFNRFSTDYIGEGEGAQAFGWGLYFSKRKGVARGYANTAYKRNTYLRYSDEIIDIINKHDEIIKKVKSDSSSDLLSDVGALSEAGHLANLVDVKRNLEIALDDVVLNINISGILKEPNSIKGFFNTRKEIKKYESLRKEILNLLKEIEGLEQNGYPRRNLYTVEIPDSGYIKWYEPIETDIKKILLNDKQIYDAYERHNELLRERIIENALRDNDQNTADQFRKAEFSSFMEELDAYENFGDAYNHLASYLNESDLINIRGDEYISKLLNENGYKGIEYPIGTVRGGYDPNATDMNYVVFNEDDIKITDHIFFSDLDNKEKLGWFLRTNGERYINIMRNADPSTLIHELAHHFLSVLTPDMPAYNLIHEVYAKSIEKDGGKIGKKTNEAFAKDLEKYVFLRKSSNSRLNAIFQKLYDVAKSLWQTLRGDVRLSSQKVKMFDSIFAEEQIPETVSAEVAKTADKVMASDSDTKMSDMADELSEETPQNVEETAETIEKQASEIIEKTDAEIAEIVTEAGVDYVPDPEPESETVPEGMKTIDIPQTEQEIEAGEPIQKEIVEKPAEDKGLRYVMDMDATYDIAPDATAFYRKRMNNGKIDAKKIEKQINKKNNQKYFDEISARYEVDSPIVGMASTVNIYKAVSGITGVPNLDTDFAEFFYAKDGGIYVLLKKDIRRDAEDEVTLFLLDKPEPKFWKIPFSGDDISVDDIAYEYYLDNIPEIVEREYTEDADGNIIYREDAEAAPTEDEDIADQDKYDITEDTSDDEADYKTETRVKNTFTGYSDPFVTAITFAKSYEINPKLYFSTNNTEAVREAADLIEESLSNTTIANAYKRFTKYIEELKKKFSEDFDDFIKDEYDDRPVDIDQERENFVWEEIAKTLQLEDLDASQAEQFAAFLFITERNGILSNMAAIPSDMRDDVVLTIARDLINASKSYLTNGKILRDGLSNPKLFNNAVKLLQELIRSMSKANNVTQIRDSIASMLRNDRAANAFQTDKPIAGIWLDVYKAFQKDRNMGNVTEDQVRTLIDALVDDKGTPRFVTETKDGLYLTSPLIVLSNFYSAKGMDVNKSNDSFSVASYEYLSLSQKQLRERINPEETTDKATAAFINLFRMARNKMGNSFLGTYFSNRMSMSKADALLAAMSKKIDSLKKEASEVRENPETMKQLKESEKQVSKLQRTIERLQNALTESKGNITELKKKIREQAKDNEILLEWVSEIDSLGTMEEIQARINDMQSQYDALQRKHDRMIADRDAKIAELKKRIDYLQNHAPEIKTAREIRDEFDKIIESIRKRIDRGNARVSVQLKEIYDYLMSDTDKDIKYNPDIFQARWSEFNGYYNMLKYFVESRMVKDGKLVTNIAALDLNDLAQLDDIINNIVGFGIDEMNYRKMQEDTKWARRMTYALRGIPKFSNLEFNHEAMDKLIKELENGIAPGSVESRIESGAISGLISEFTQIDNALKAINPALHNIIFGGGLVEGERISDNLNSAQEQYVKMVNERQHKIAEKFAEIFKPSDFGLNKKGNKFTPEDFMIYQERSFRNEHVKIGNMSVKEFEAKYGSFGKITQKGAVFTGQVSAMPGTMWYELSKRILSEELQYRRNEIKFKKTPEELSKMKDRYKEVMSGEMTRTFTMENLMEIYKLAMQKDGLNRLIIAPESGIATNNLSIENILWVIDKLNGDLSNYGRFAEALQKIEAERYADLADVYYLTEDEILPEINFYSAIRDDRSVMEEVNQKDLRVNASTNERSSLDTSFIKERTNPKRAADLNGISIAMNAIRDQEKYISQAILLKKYSEMFKKNGALDLALEKAYGTDGKQLSSLLRKWLGQIIDENNRSPRTRTENTIAKLRGNMVRSVLWAAPSVIMQQFPTYILVARRIGLRNATAQLFSTIHNRKGVAQFVYSKSKQMKDRARIETAEYRQRAGEFAKDPIFLEKLKREGYSRRALRGREQFEKFIRWGMDLQQKVDTAVANSMWLALYNNYKATMDRGNLSDDDFDAMVSERATQEVLSIQPSQYAKDNAIVYNSRNEYLKSFLLFTSSLNKEFNMIYEDYLSGKFNGFTREKIGNLIESFMYISLVSLAISFISGRQWPDDDDDKELKATLSRMAKGTISEVFGIIPGIGSILSDVATGEVYYDTGTAGTILNLIKVLAKNPEDRREGQLANAISRSFVEAFQLAGIPSNTPMKIYDAITELNPGELMNSQWADFYSYIRD